MRKYKNEESFWNQVIPNIIRNERSQLTSSLKTYENASELILKDSNWERCSKCERILASFSSNQIAKEKSRCIQCVAESVSKSSKKRKRKSKSRDTSLRREKDPFLAIRDVLRREGDYAVEDDNTLPGAIINQDDLVSNIGRVRVDNKAAKQESKKERQAAEYTQILKKREKEKEQRRKRMEASRTNVACIYFAQGNCVRGTECRYSHDITITTKSHVPCIYFRNGQCKRGKDCAFRHDVRDINPEEPVLTTTKKNDKFDMSYSFILNCSVPL